MFIYFQFSVFLILFFCLDAKEAIPIAIGTSRLNEMLSPSLYILRPEAGSGRSVAPDLLYATFPLRVNVSIERRWLFSRQDYFHPQLLSRLKRGAEKFLFMAVRICFLIS